MIMNMKMTSTLETINKNKIKKIPTNFRLNSSIKEGHKKPIYCVSWSTDKYKKVVNNDNTTTATIDCGSNEYQLMATCGGNYVTIYEIQSKLEIRDTFIDEDTEEEYWACAFGWKSFGSYTDEFTYYNPDKKVYDEETIREQPELWNGPQLLCVGGKSGILKVIDPVRRCRLMTFVGHGGDIYDIKFSPENPQLCLTASVDTSIRLWDLSAISCVAVFSGHEGHRATVISTSFHLSGTKFASAGMDHCIKIWSIPSQQNKMIHEQLPIFSTQMVHTDYIDCVQFIGDCILSKSVNNSLLLWKPILDDPKKRKEGDIIPLREIPITNCEVWFLRFDVNFNHTLLALGNSVGNVNVWYLNPNDDATYVKHKRGEPLCVLTHALCSSVVRMVSFSPDGNSLVYCCDNSTIWKFDAVF